MRIHINLRTDHPNQLALVALILYAKGKLLEAQGYCDNPFEMAAGVKRCRWVRYRMEGGGGPQKHNREEQHETV